LKVEPAAKTCMGAPGGGLLCQNVHLSSYDSLEVSTDDERLLLFLLCVTEYDSVNNALDEISAFMDVLEERNEQLFAKVQQLLEDSRHARLQAELQDQESSDHDKPSSGQQPSS